MGNVIASSVADRRSSQVLFQALFARILRNDQTSYKTPRRTPIKARGKKACCRNLVTRHRRRKQAEAR